MGLLSFIGILFSFNCLSLSDSFAPIRTTHPTVKSLCASSSSTLLTDPDQNLKPKYEVEPLPIRIGHGFDIHKMVPVKEAGQPIVIAGVVIEHKDLKVQHKHLIHVCYIPCQIWFILKL